MKKCKIKPIILKEGLRIDFVSTDGQRLNYLRFEDVYGEDCPSYLGSIDCEQKIKLTKLRNQINYLLRLK